MSLPAGLASDQPSIAESTACSVQWAAHHMGPPDAWPDQLRFALRMMFDCPVPMFIVWGAHRTLFYNDAYIPILGDSHPRAMGIPMEQVWPSGWPEAEPLVRQAMAGIPVKRANAHFILHRNGRDERTSFDFAYTPITAPQGKVLGFQCIVQETTETNELRERQRAQQELLRESEERFRTIANAMPQLVFGADADGANDYFNDQLLEFTGLSPEQLRGDGWFAIIHPDELAEVGAAWRAALATECVFEMAFRIRHHSGAYRWSLSRALPCRDRDGTITRWLGTCTDIEYQKRTEAALVDARMRLRVALEAAEIGTWTYDIERDQVFADRNIQTIFGVSDAEANGGAFAHYYKAIHPDDLPVVQAQVGAAIAERGAYHTYYRVRSQDGTYRHFLARGKVTLNERGEPWLPGVLIDVTQQRLAEQALAESQARFGRLMESNLLGIVQYRPDGRLVEPNDAFLHALGLSRTQFDAAAMTWQTLLREPGPGGRHDWFMQAGGVEPFEHEIRRADGSRLLAFIAAAALDGPDAAGIACMLDITKARAAEHALAASEAKFRVMTDAMPQMVWSTLPDGYHEHFNEQWYQYTGLPRGATDGDRWNNVFHPDDQARAMARWKQSLADGTPYEIEYRLRHHSGQYRWVLGRALPVRDDSGRIIRWMGTCTDIDAQKRAQHELRDADQRKDEFLAMLAHELRNPLAPIATAASVLTMPGTPPAKVTHIASVIRRQTAHMTALVDDLLDVSRVTRGLISLTMQPAGLRDLIEEAIEQTRPLLEARQHSLSVEVDGLAASLVCDRKRIVQVLANVLANAAKYTPAGGRIAVTADSAADAVRFTVSDNGIGMSPELTQRAFDLFCQGERTPDRSQGGLGIGLALVKSLVQLHGGRVHAESPGKDLGSTVVIHLPRRPSPDEAVRIDDGAAAATVGRRSVLIIDDNRDAVELACMHLELLGYQVYCEYSASAALATAAAVRPDIALLDIGLPDMDGKDLARALRKLPGLQDIRLAALTGYGQPQDRIASLAAGFDEHFVKPVESQRLAAWLSEQHGH